MSAVAIAALFIVAGLWVRRRYGGAALAGLTVATAAITAAIASASFLVLLQAVGVPATGANAIVIALMLVTQSLSYGCAAMAIHVMHKKEGPWITAPGLLLALLGYVAGGVLAALIAFAAITTGAVAVAK
jgi:hypothetical protein